MDLGTSNAVYENEHYALYPSSDSYLIVNRRTGVKEGFSEVLSSAISKSDVWSNLLEEIKERKCGA